MRRWMRLWMGAGMLWMAGACGAFGQGLGGMAGALGPERMEILEVLRNGGVLMYVLAGVSVLMVAFVMYFLAVLRPQQAAPRSLLREILSRIDRGTLEEVRMACDDRPCALAAVTLAAVDFMESGPNPDAVLLKDVVEGEGARQAAAIQGQTHYLVDIAAIAPMLGLLGTVLGMLRAFNAVALDIAKARPIELAGGVSQALVTTVGGLVVAIPAMAFYAFFRGRAARVVAGLEEASADVMMALLRKRAE